MNIAPKTYSTQAYISATSFAAGIQSLSLMCTITEMASPSSAGENPVLLEEARQGEDAIASGKDILFIGTKKQAQEIVREAATANVPYCVNRWMGGGLTNFTTIKSSLAKYRKFLKMDQEGELKNSW